MNHREILAGAAESSLQWANALQGVLEETPNVPAMAARRLALEIAIRREMSVAELLVELAGDGEEGRRSARHD